MTTGLYKVGKAPLAKIASTKTPFSIRTSSPVSASVAIQTKGIGSLEKSLTKRLEYNSLLNKL